MQMRQHLLLLKYVRTVGTHVVLYHIHSVLSHTTMRNTNKYEDNIDHLGDTLLIARSSVHTTRAKILLQIHIVRIVITYGIPARTSADVTHHEPLQVHKSADMVRDYIDRLEAALFFLQFYDLTTQKHDRPQNAVTFLFSVFAKA